MKRKSFLALMMPALLATSFLFTACEGDNDPDKDPNIQYEATLNSGQLVGVDQSSTGTGTFTGTYNRDSNVLTYNINLTGLTPTRVYFAQAQPGVNNGTVDIVIPNATGPAISGSVTLNQRQENDLVYGNYAVIVETAQFPRGAVRGNIMMRRN